MYEITNIARIRKTLKLTQKEFAEHINVTISTISCYEVRKRAPSAKSLRELSKLLRKIEPPLGITIEQILEDYK